MKKHILSFAAALAACITMTVPADAFSWAPGFDTYGGYTNTKTQYYFMTERAILGYYGEGNTDILTQRAVYAGTDLYIPIGYFEPTSGGGAATGADDDDDDDKTVASSGVKPVATDKMVKNDSVELSYKVLEGETYVDNIQMVAGKKEKKQSKIDELETGMYAKVTFANNYMPLEKTRVAVRLVLSVNGVSYQQTSVTFYCDLQNRVETISRNSVYGALIPMQLRTARNYNGEITIDFGDGIRFTTTVESNKQYYVNLDREMDQALKDMYPDAYIECYDFKGSNDAFASTGQLVIPISEKKFKEKKTKAEVYVYTKVGNSLRAISLNTAHYDNKNEKIILDTDSLASYVLSSRPLMKNINNDEYDVLRSGYADSVLEYEEDEPEED